MKKKNKTLNEQPTNNPQIEGFGLVADAFRLNTENRDKNPVEYLYMEWNFPTEIIDKYFEELGNSFDETNKFLNILDGADSEEEAIQMYENEQIAYILLVCQKLILMFH